jgi:hypothetical protein
MIAESQHKIRTGYPSIHVRCFSASIPFQMKKRIRQFKWSRKHITDRRYICNPGRRIDFTLGPSYIRRVWWQMSSNPGIERAISRPLSAVPAEQFPCRAAVVHPSPNLDLRHAILFRTLHCFRLKSCANSGVQSAMNPLAIRIIMNTKSSSFQSKLCFS